MRSRILEFFEPPIAGSEDGSAGKLAWVVRLRWIAIAAQAASVAPALHFELLEPAVLPAFAGVVGALAVFNVLTWSALRRGDQTVPGSVVFQLAVDVLALSTLLALTGGAWNPLLPLLFVHAGLGALLLEGRASLGFLWLLLGCVLGVQALGYVPAGLERTRVAPEVLFPAQILLTGVFWLLASWLSRTLNLHQAHAQALREHAGRLDRLRAVGALAAGLSHELATPLNTAMLKVERLARKAGLEDNPDLRDASEALERCEDVLRHMVGSQLEPDGLGLERVDLADLARQVCVSASAGEWPGRVHFQPYTRERAQVLVPTIAVSQALLNLIDNACEVHAEDPRVEVRVRSEREVVTLDVCDRGSGWPDVVRSHLGEPFVTTKPDGVGLGLYFVSTLAAAVGGEFRLLDRDGGGAIARLILPRVAGRAMEART